MLKTSIACTAYPDSQFLVDQPAWMAGRRAAVILMATDGTERADGALRVAAARARATGATLEVLSVIESETVISAEALHLGESEMVRRWNARRAAVEAQVARVLGTHTFLSISIAEGNPVYTVSRVAIERRASVIVVGHGRHQAMDRIFGTETAIQLARIARVPVLAVPQLATAAPRHAVVAVDFSEISMRAAQAALESVTDDGHVDLVHVMPLVADETFTVEVERSYERWAQARMATMTEQLVVPDGITVHCEVIRGRPAPELIEYAVRAGADMISTGTHGRGFVARALLGSVTTNLLRRANCAVLAIPRDPLPALAAMPQDAMVGDADDSPLAWSALLDDFSRRNSGRRTILEVDDLEIGAQAQEFNYPLIGATYSERDGRLNLMLGDRFASGRHLTRTIGNVIAVDVLTDGAGHDVALRVQHGASQTLVTFAA